MHSRRSINVAAISTAAFVVSSLGWYMFLHNSLTAPSRGHDLYSGFVSVGAAVQVVPSALISSAMTWFATRMWNPNLSRWLATGVATAVIAVHLLALEIATRALVNSA